jgi:hypothetical protein
VEVRSAANVLQAAAAQGIPLAYIDANRLDVLAGLDISLQAKAFIMDAVQRGYGVLAPERMAAWGDGEAVAWWQLDLATGEMVGVGEDGTHQFLVQLTAEARFFVNTVQLMQWLVEVTVKRARYLAYRAAAATTWTYFWRRAVPGAIGVGLTPEQVFTRALQDTKTYIATTVWPEFEGVWEVMR